MGEGRPNVVMVVGDDLRSADLRVLPNVRALLADRGLAFAHCFVTTPLCGPSRAPLLRGQLAHNHGC
jgi:arylsulfatase A-like enzyme